MQFAIISIVSPAFGLAAPPYGPCLLIAYPRAYGCTYFLRDTVIMLIPILLALIVWRQVRGGIGWR